MRGVACIHVPALRAVLAGALLALASLAHSQGGPPLVTDDPGTPGDGEWEINLAALGSHTAQRWEASLFDADINYGWGERVQLKLDVPLSYARDAGSSARVGFGAVDAGVKWRFVDADDAGFSMSTYPQYTTTWSRASRRHGIASADDTFFLPVEIAKSVGGFEFGAELGRNFIERESDEWEAGVVAAHGCGGTIECLIEVHETAAPHDRQTLVNFGLHVTIDERLALLASAGRDFGSDSIERQRLVFYVGVQLLR